MSATKLIPSEMREGMEPLFTCSLSQEDIRGFLDKTFDVPEFSIHTQSTERAVKHITDTAASVVGQEA